METVMSILHRLVGPVMLAMGLSVLYLLGDVMSLYISTVDGHYADAYTYEQGKPASYDEPETKGSDVLAVLTNGVDVGVTVYVVHKEGNYLDSLTYKCTKTLSGWDCSKGFWIDKSFVLSSEPAADIDTVRASIGFNENFKTVTVYSQSLEYTAVAYVKE